MFNIKAPWLNMSGQKLPWGNGKKTAFFNSDVNYIAGEGYEDGKNEGGPIHHDH